MEKIAYLGPEGSYSHLAAQKIRPCAEGVAYSSFYLAVNALKNGQCDCAVLPIENSLNGAVLQNIDLLHASENIVAVEELTLTLDHRLATLNGAKKEGINRIFSHEQPLAQCAEYLHENFPTAQLISTPSTAASLDMVKTTSDAAIVGAHIMREGICLSPHNIADSNTNYTHFLLVKTGQIDKSKKCKKIFFSITCRHASGALLDILEPLRADGLNMTKIQSRPIKERTGEYRFFIEVEGDYSDRAVQATFDKLEKIALSLKLLGAY